MKLLFDFFPVLLFFITFKMHEDPQRGILVATAVIIAATLVQVGVTWFRNRRVEKMHVVTLVLVVIFGGATLLLKDEIFIKWKPTVVNWLFAIAFLASEFIGSKNLVRRMMESSVQLPDFVWRRLNLSWVMFFTVMGVLNLYVVYNFDTDTWVDFKLFGLLILPGTFMTKTPRRNADALRHHLRRRRKQPTKTKRRTPGALRTSRSIEARGSPGAGRTTSRRRCRRSRRSRLQRQFDRRGV
jgi:intracellular septation protein